MKKLEPLSYKLVPPPAGLAVCATSPPAALPLYFLRASSRVGREH